MKKALKWIVVGTFVLLVLLLAGFTMFGGAMVKGAVNKVGPAVCGVPVTLEDATFRPLAGTVSLKTLHVGNPPGFRTPALLDVGQVSVELDVMSLFSDVIVVRKIAVVSPHITYERGLLGSNFGALTKHLQGGTGKKATDKKPGQESAGGGKKVVIDELVITDPALNVSVTAGGGHYIPVKLGKVELKGVGREQGGVTAADAMKIVFSVVASNVENAVAGAGDLVGEGAKAVGNGAKAVGETVAEGASSVIKGVGSLLGGEKKPDSEPADKH